MSNIFTGTWKAWGHGGRQFTALLSAVHQDPAKESQRQSVPTAVLCCSSECLVIKELHLSIERHKQPVLTGCRDLRARITDRRKS